MTQRTLIVGLGVTGVSCVRHLAGRDELTVLDTREQPPGLAEARAEHPEIDYRLGACDIDFASFDRVVLSPGLKLRSALGRRIQASGLPVLSDIDLFCRAVDEPIYAITGTNGKSTVTAWVGHALAQLNHRPGVGGNLGEAALDIIGPDRDCYVLELSSFQLERMQTYPYRAATVLNVSVDHLDHHGSLAAYAAAKRRIYRQAERLIVNRDDPLSQPEPRPGGSVITFGAGTPGTGQWGVRTLGRKRWLAKGGEAVIEARRLPIAGGHNECNALAVLALINGDMNGSGLAALGESLLGYRGLAHRCEVVGVVGGVTYINDSKATNPGATVAALSSLSKGPGRIVLIAGGEGKGADFAALGQAIAARARCLIPIGQDGPAIAEAAGLGRRAGRPCHLAEAVRQAAKCTRPGDTVLLSPACASFDHFSDFRARGEAFRALVKELRP